MKIYTGMGDKGRTSLFSGERVAKNSPRVDAYGDLDELNAVLGAMISTLSALETGLIEELHQIQSHLLHAGAWLATSPGSATEEGLNEITPAHAEHLEHLIDTKETGLAPLSEFILPGGHASASWAHIARTVCRRVERKIAGLLSEVNGTATQLKNIIIYINRLSDYLFVLSRYCNHIHGTPDIPWRK